MVKKEYYVQATEALSQEVLSLRDQVEWLKQNFVLPFETGDIPQEYLANVLQRMQAETDKTRKKLLKQFLLSGLALAEPEPETDQVSDVPPEPAFEETPEGKILVTRLVTPDEVFGYIREKLRQQFERSDFLESPTATKNFLLAQLAQAPHELFSVIYLDNRHRVISYEEVFQGTIDSATVHIREMIRRVMIHNAAALVLAHNHPSGIGEPSTADKLITDRIKKTMKEIDVRVLDHIIVAGSETMSFAEKGLI